MGRRRSSSRRAAIFSRIVWTIWTMIAGGSVAGWLAPEMPIVGPIVSRVVTMVISSADKDNPSTSAPDQSLGPSETSVAVSQTAASQGSSPAGSDAVARPTTSRKPSQSVLIASFNIQVFGTSKLSKPAVVDVLAQVIRQFDVVAIQEIRSKDDSVLATFATAVNADGSRYGYAIGPRLGRTFSKEQYAFLYDVNRVELDRSSVGNLTDPDDLLHREPFVARFIARNANRGIPFSFWLVNIHTDPDEVSTEVDALADVFQIMQHARADEDDVILLGDLNAGEQQFGRLGQIPNITWAIRGTATNTRGTKMYDNLIFQRMATSEFTGRWGVVDLQSAFGLTLDQALQVSDHLPVWAEFHNLEIPQQAGIASQPGWMTTRNRRY